MTQDHGLRILVVDQDRQRGQTLSEVLRISGYDVVNHVSCEDFLPNIVDESQPDVILIDLDSPDRDTLEHLAAIDRDLPRPVVMFAKDDDEKTIERAVHAGVSAYIVDGMSEWRVKPVIDVAVAHFRQYQALRVKLEEAETSLEERKWIDRAKGLLMKQRGLSEPEAFAMLRKLAMDRKKRLGQAARDVAEVLGQIAATSPESGADRPGLARPSARRERKRATP